MLTEGTYKCKNGLDMMIAMGIGNGIFYGSLANQPKTILVYNSVGRCIADRSNISIDGKEYKRNSSNDYIFSTWDIEGVVLSPNFKEWDSNEPALAALSIKEYNSVSGPISGPIIPIVLDLEPKKPEVEPRKVVNSILELCTE